MKSLVEFIKESHNINKDMWPNDENRQWEGEYAIIYAKPGTPEEKKMLKDIENAPEGFYKVTNKDRKETVFIYPLSTIEYKHKLGSLKGANITIYEMPEDFTIKGMGGKYAGVEEFMNSFINGNDAIETLKEIKF